jgi:hypothetical protein
VILYQGAATTPNVTNPGAQTRLFASCFSFGTYAEIPSGTSKTYIQVFNAPNQPGLQVMTFDGQYDYVCKFPDPYGIDQCAARAWAAICVLGDSDSDGNW